jgi:hypothetical protein
MGDGAGRRRPLNLLQRPKKIRNFPTTLAVREGAMGYTWGNTQEEEDRHFRPQSTFRY